MIKRRTGSIHNGGGLFDMTHSASATDLTGFIPSAPQNDYVLESYGGVMDFMSSAAAIDAAAKKVKKELDDTKA